MFEQTTKVQIDLQIFPNFRKSAKVPHGPWSQDQTFPRLWDRPVCEFGMICTLFCKKPVRVMKLDPPSSNIQDKTLFCIKETKKRKFYETGKLTLIHGLLNRTENVVFLWAADVKYIRVHYLSKVSYKKSELIIPIIVHTYDFIWFD